MRRLAFLVLILAGCPHQGAQVEGPASIASGVPATGKIAKPKGGTPAAPVTAPAGTFSKETLVELYRADVLGTDAERKAAHAKHGLVDAQGKDVAARVAEYEAALKRFAEERPDEWSALADDLEATRRARPDVQPK